MTNDRGKVLDALIFKGRLHRLNAREMMLAQMFFNAAGSAGTDYTVTGSLPLTLPSALAKPLVSLTREGKVEQRNLPKEYTELEYIQSTGTQYIDTGIVPTNSSDIDVQFKRTDGISSGGAVLGGRPAGVVGEGFLIGYSSAPQFTVDYFGGSSSERWITGLDFSVNKTYRVTIINKVCVIYEDGVQIGTHTFNAAGSIIQTVALFGLNNGGTVTPAALGGLVINHVKIGTNTFVPAKRLSDNVLGMYDLVSGQFLTNAGTGAFTAGATVTPTPDRPMDLWCNNGKLKLSPNLITATPAATWSGNGITVTTNGDGVYRFSGTTTADNVTTGIFPIKSFVIPTSVGNGGKGSIGLFNNTTTNALVLFNNNDTTVEQWYIQNEVNRFSSSYTAMAGQTINGISFNFLYSGVNVDGLTIAPAIFNDGRTSAGTFIKGGIYADGTPEVLTVGSTVELSTTSILGNIDTDLKYRTNVNGDCAATPVTIGKTYRLRWTNTDSATVGIVFRYAFVDTDTPTSAGVETSQAVRTTIQTVGTTPIVLTADKPYLITQCNQGKTVSNITDGYLVCEEVIQTASVPNLLAVSDYKDTAELISGLQTHKVGVKVFDGTESFSKSSTYGAAFFIQAAAGWWGAQNGIVMCSHYLGLATTSSAAAEGTCFFNPSGHLYFRVADNSDTVAFKAFLAAQYAVGTPVIVIYPLATETTEQTTPQPLTTSKGTNVVDSVNNVPPVSATVVYKKR